MSVKHSRFAKMALATWSAISALLAVSSLAIFILKGAEAFSILITDPPLSDLTITMYSTLIVWLLAGAFVFLLYFNFIHADNALMWAGFFVIGLVYVNILRERVRYGDMEYYIRAAMALHKGEPLPFGYVYPLLWASILEIFAPYKEEGIFLFAWLLNIAALFGMYFLLVKTLEKYDFAPNLAALIATAFMLVNVPLLRTMVYGQVNLLVLDGMLLSLLLYRRSPFISALALAIAVQIKISPIVLVAAILFERDGRWLAWFAVHMIVLSALPILAHGIEPYNQILKGLGTLGPRTFFYFRDSSFDSIFTATASLLGINLIAAQILTYASKLTVGLCALWAAFSSIRNATFHPSTERGKYFYNAAPILMLLLTMVSPLVWEHYGVFLSLSFLALIKRLRGDVEWFLFASACFFEFAIPAFDFYPWSYVRLAAPLIILWLIWVVSRRNQASPTFENLNRWAQALPHFAKS